MVSGWFCQTLSAASRLRFAKMLSAASELSMTNSIVPGERAPGRRLGICPQPRGAKRRQALVRIAAPGGSPCGKACPFSGRERPAHNAGRRAYRRFTAAFFLRPRDRLLETDRGPLYGKPLIPQSFSPCVHPPPPARCRTDPCSWAGQ